MNVLKHSHCPKRTAVKIAYTLHYCCLTPHYQWLMWSFHSRTDSAALPVQREEGRKSCLGLSWKLVKC